MEPTDTAGSPRTAWQPFFPSSSRRARRSALVAALAIAAPLALFVPLAAEAWQKDVSTWDGKVSRTLHGDESHTLLGRRIELDDVILHPVVEAAGVLVVVFVLLVLTARRRLRPALMIALALGGVLVFEPILKNIFQRPPMNPEGGGYSFPSGSAMRSMAAAAAFTVVMWPTRGRWPTTLLSAFVVGLVGIAIVSEGWHWASDVLGGWCISVAWVAALCFALRYLAPVGSDESRLRDRAPGSDDDT
jgi:membrane-associated phospholipid phosphatase